MLTNEQLIKVGISPEQYNELDDNEKLVIEQVLNELASGEGVSQTYESLYYADYDEIPVSFAEFLFNDQYLGKTTRNGEFLYPYWRKELGNIFAHRHEISEVALSGSIGIGKTTAAVLGMAYHLYVTMCMKDPQAFFGLSPGSEITFAFLNNTMASSYGVAYKTFQAFIQESPWFLKHGKIAGRTEPTYYPEKGFGFIVGSKPQHTLGRHIIGAIMDEVSFAPGQSVSYESSKIMLVYTNIRRRMESRFMRAGRNYGMMWLVSSKATESSFLESYIADQVKKGYPIYVVDQPLWVVKPAAYSGKMFKVAVGNKYVKSRVLDKTPDAEELKALKAQGYRVIDVPVEHRQAFDQDLDKALQDIAGISTSVVTKAFSYERIQKCKDPNLWNPVTQEILTIGLHDDLQIKDFFRPDMIPENVLGAPIFVHIDTALKGDRKGIGAVAIIGTKDVTTYGANVGEVEISEELVYQQVLDIGIECPSDSEISFEKTRQFIYYLKEEVGLNIKVVSTDGFQSADMRQIFTTKGYNAAYTSLDRTPDGYDGLKSAINDQRIILLNGTEKCDEELSDIERDNITGKYDHTTYGSKDLSDGLAGAFLDAMKYKDEYLFFAASDYDYEGLNERSNDKDKLVNEMKSAVTQDRKVTKDNVDPAMIKIKSKNSDDFFTDDDEWASQMGFNSSNMLLL